MVTKKKNKAEGNKEKKEKKAKALAAKKKKQELKSQKKAGKKKQGQDGEEDDLEALLKEFQLNDSKKTKIETINLDGPPSPRNYLSICNIPKSDDIFIFGGEYFDGDKSRVFNEVFKYNPLKAEWKQIICTNPPPPRCSHQAVAAIVGEKPKIYVFGGEFCTTYSFYHYRDLWEFDVETSAFNAIHQKNGPSPRSGHRMLLYKHYLVLFGGFYETSRGTNFYSDLHFFNLRTQNWFIDEDSANNKSLNISNSRVNSNCPPPRSACHFFHDPNRNCFYVYGGYTKAKGRGKNLDDLWQLDLNFKADEKVSIKWERLSSKGIASPGKRSGASSCVFKNKLILFGGVKDVETMNDVEGEFFSDLFAFDFGRRRWFPIEANKTEISTKKGRRRKDDKKTVASSSIKDVESDSETDDDEGYYSESNDFDDNAFYYIVNGEMVKIEMDPAENEGESNETSLSDEANVVNDNTPELVSQDMAEIEPEQEERPTLVEESTEQSDEVEVAQEVPAEEQLSDEPMGRIGSAVFIQGNELNVLYGTCEIADYHVNFDDIWKINVLKNPQWVKVHEGAWKDKLDEVDNEQEEASDSPEDDLEDQELDGEIDRSEYLDEEYTNNLAKEVKKLRKQVESYDDELIPNSRETLREFFKRTWKAWVEKFVQIVQNKETTEESLRFQGKELRRKAFAICEERYYKLADVLERLDEVGEEQELLEKQAVKQMKIDAIKASGGKLKKKQ